MSGNPGHGAQEWTREDKWYSKITTSVKQVRDDDTFLMILGKGENIFLVSGEGLDDDTFLTISKV